MTIDKQTIKAIQSNIDVNTKELTGLINRCVSIYSKELDNEMNYVKSLLYDDTRTITNEELDDIILRLPQVLYWASAGLETVGIKEDLSKIVKENKLLELLPIMTGTAAIKKLSAEQESNSEILVEIIYDSAYKQLKNKISFAVEMLQSAKKILSRRMAEADWSNNATNRTSDKDVKRRF